MGAMCHVKPLRRPRSSVPLYANASSRGPSFAWDVSSPSFTMILMARGRCFRGYLFSVKDSAASLRYFARSSQVGLYTVLRRLIAERLTAPKFLQVFPDASVSHTGGTSSVPFLVFDLGMYLAAKPSIARSSTMMDLAAIWMAINHLVRTRGLIHAVILSDSFSVCLRPMCIPLSYIPH